MCQQNVQLDSCEIVIGSEKSFALSEYWIEHHNCCASLLAEMLNNAPSNFCNFILHLTYFTCISLLINLPLISNPFSSPICSRKTLSWPPKHTQIGSLNSGGNSLFNEPTHARFGGQEDPVRKTPLVSSPPCNKVGLLYCMCMDLQFL